MNEPLTILAPVIAIGVALYGFMLLSRLVRAFAYEVQPDPALYELPDDGWTVSWGHHLEQRYIAQLEAELGIVDGLETLGGDELP